MKSIGITEHVYGTEGVELVVNLNGIIILVFLLEVRTVQINLICDKSSAKQSTWRVLAATKIDCKKVLVKHAVMVLISFPT